MLEVQHHATMLNDRFRLDQFKKAINWAVGPQDVCVDIGCGTGILSSYAARLTKKKVYGIEYFRATADFARDMVQANGIKNIEIVNKSSYRRPIEAEPKVLVSETIGSVGPEENVVEIFYEFCKSYPSIERKIPYELSLWAVPIYSSSIESETNKLVQGFLGAGCECFDFSQKVSDIKRLHSSRVINGVINDAEFRSTPVQLVDYKLGSTSRSDFSKTFRFDVKEPWNAVHIFFIAKLDPFTKLTSSIVDPLTHWRHSYIVRPSLEESVRVAYSSKTKGFEINWEEGA